MTLTRRILIKPSPSFNSVFEQYTQDFGSVHHSDLGLNGERAGGTRDQTIRLFTLTRYRNDYTVHLQALYNVRDNPSICTADPLRPVGLI